MTRKEKIALLIDELEDIRCCNFDANTDEDKTLKEAVRVIKVLEQEPKWIPVSERLPEENKTVIASTTTYGVYPETRYTKEYGWEWAYEAGADYWRELKDVLAWMPLPEPYKAESEDKE